jgi:hypothetical protein
MGLQDKGEFFPQPKKRQLRTWATQILSREMPFFLTGLTAISITIFVYFSQT